MRVSSASQASYVDLRDGFTNLPFLTDQFLATSIAELKGEDISTVLHEFTHQLSLASPLGLIFAYHIALDLANKAYMAYLAKLLGRDTGKTDKAAAATLEIYVDEYSESIRTFNNAVQTLRWLFEGIAMFAELNYASSKKYPIASKHWNLLMVLLNGIQQELPKDEPTNEELIRQVEDLLASSSLEQHRAAMRKSLFFDKDLRTAPYFAGYLLIKGLQKRLSQKDERLSDPEVLLVFLLGSFFHNRFLLGLVPLSGNASFEFRENYIKQKLMTYVQGSLRRILDADPSTLKKAVDRIVNHTEFTTK